MATIQDAIKRLIYQFTSTGADKVAADNNMVADSQAKLAISAQTTTKASLDLTKAFENLEKRFQTTAGVQQQYEAIQAKVNAAVAQHPELQQRANDVLENAAKRFDVAKGSGDAFSKMMESARGAALGLAAGIGPIGAVLGSFGPWGVAAAAGIGLVTNALAYMRENAEKIGDQSSGLRQFSDTTGLTIAQVRGLNDAGGTLGVSADAMAAAIQKFTLNLSDARKGGGDLYDQLRIIDKQLADDISNTRDGAQALDILSKAYNSTADATTKAAIARAAFGKGGASVGPVLDVLSEEGGVNKYSADVSKALGVTDEWTKKVAALRNENKSLEEDLKLIEASFYSQSMLERQNQALKTQIEIAKLAREAANLPGGPTSQQRNPFVQESARSAGVERPFPVGGDPVVDSAPSAGAIDKDKAAIESATQAKIDNLNATIRMASETANLVSALGSEATAAEKEQARIEALTVAFEAGKISAETYMRALDSDTSRAAEQITAIGRAWGNVSESTALQLQAMQNSLPVAQQWTESGRMKAQYEATYLDLINKGKTAEEAGALAAKQYETSKAAAVASAEKLVQSSQDNLDKIQAQGTGMEGVVASTIAYRDAMQAGATQTQAAAIAANTLAASMAQAAQSAAQAEQQAYNKANAADASGVTSLELQRQYTHASTDPLRSGRDLSFAPNPMSPVTYGQGTGRNLDLGVGGTKGSLITQQAQASMALYQQLLSQAGGLAGYTLANSGGDIDAAISKVAMSGASNVTSQLSTLYQLKNSQTDDKGAQIGNDKAFLSWLQTQPKTLENLQAIASLTTEIKNLAASTDNLNATNQELLSPYYAQDPRTSHIGFRSQGMATGGWVDVPGAPSANDNMIAQIPVAGGERIYVDPNKSARGLGDAGNSQIIQVTNHITIQGSADKNEVGRTMYQVGQTMAKQLQAAQR